MPDRRKNRVKPIPLVVGSNPDLWRFESLHEALAQGIDPIATLIHHGEELQSADAHAEADISAAQLAAR